MILKKLNFTPDGAMKRTERVEAAIAYLGSKQPFTLNAEEFPVCSSLLSVL